MNLSKISIILYSETFAKSLFTRFVPLNALTAFTFVINIFSLKIFDFMATLTLDQTTTSNQSRTSDGLLAIPLYIYMGVFASMAVLAGILWDISWHMSIGRDGLFSPPHDLVYLGATLAGVFSGFQVLKTSFWGTDAEKAKMVNFWGIFYSSLGGLFCIWGCISALTSAPFDDWWHNTYGLDIKIASPPHTVLGLGLIAIQMGSMVAVLSILNQNEKISHLTNAQNDKRIARLRWMFMASAAILLAMMHTFLSEFLGRWNMHAIWFYQVGAFAFPLFLVGASRASGIKWGATNIALIMMISHWAINAFLRLLPAEPMLGPIMNHITTYQTLGFPILIVFPAMAIDYCRAKFADKNDWLLSVLIGVGFLVVFVLVQYPAGTFFQESTLARTWFFGSGSWTYNSPPDWEYRYKFAPWSTSTVPMEWVTGLGIALVLSIFSTRISLFWGNWMKKVQR